MPATTMGANENFLSYVSTLSLWDTGEEKKKKGRNGGRESMCEKERARDTHMVQGEIKDLGKSLCLFQLKLHIAFNDAAGVFWGCRERERLWSLNDL